MTEFFITMAVMLGIPLVLGLLGIGLAELTGTTDVMENLW